MGAVGGGGKDTLNSNGIEVFYLLHWLLEDIHLRSLWLKWHLTLLTVLRHSRISVDATDLDRRESHPSTIPWQSREKSMSKV